MDRQSYIRLQNQFDPVKVEKIQLLLNGTKLTNYCQELYKFYGLEKLARVHVYNNILRLL
ncbi:MAG: hypothetical protein Kow0049_27180 [Stanieria sp.]